MKTKLLFAAICSLVSLTTEARVNLSRFHDMNFLATGNSCGLHVEVSGNYMTITEIIPPNGNEWAAECSNNRACNGYTTVLLCSTNGLCTRADNGRAMLLLLEDGNFVNYLNNQKYVARYSGVFYTCKN